MAIMTKESHVRHEHPEKGLVSSRNVGDWERGVRLFIGVAATGAAFAVAPIWLRALLGLVGAASLFTSIGGYCPINRAIGRDSYHNPLQ
jgi:hypothetical protein